MKKLGLALVGIILISGAAYARTGALAPNLSGSLSPSTAKDISGMNVTVDGTTEGLSEWLGAFPSGNISLSADRDVTDTTDTILSSDGGRTVVYKNQAGVAVSLPAATVSGFGQGFGTTLSNRGGPITLTPASKLDNLSGPITINQNDDCTIRSTGSYFASANCPIYTYNPTYSTGDMTAVVATLPITNATTGVCSYTNATLGVSYTSVGNCAGRPKYSKTDGAYLGLAIEKQRTNSMVGSYLLGSSPWQSNFAVSRTNNALSSPDGTTNATAIVVDGAYSRGAVANNIPISPSTNYAVSGYVKVVGGANFTKVLVGPSSVEGGSGTLLIDTTSGTYYTSGPATSIEVIPAIDDWYYFRYNVVSTSAQSAWTIYAYTENNSSTHTGTFSVWGLQIEALPSATDIASSLIQTTGTALTRSADVVADVPAYWLGNEGTFCMDFAVDANRDGDYIMSDDDSDVSMLLFASATSAGSDDGTNEVDYNIALGAAETLNKTCVRYADAVSNIAVGGTIGTQGTNATFPISAIKLFSNYDGSVTTTGSIKNMRFYNWVFSDAEMQSGTTP